MRRSSSSWSLSVMSQWKAVTPFAPKRANEAIETTAPITIIVVIIGSRSAVTSRDFSSGPANVERAGRVCARTEWTQVIPNAPLCKALIDRITDRAHIIETGNESYRFRRTMERRRERSTKPKTHKPHPALRAAEKRLFNKPTT